MVSVNGLSAVPGKNLLSSDDPFIFEKRKIVKIKGISFFIISKEI